MMTHVDMDRLLHYSCVSLSLLQPVSKVPFITAPSVSAPCNSICNNRRLDNCDIENRKYRDTIKPGYNNNNNKNKNHMLVSDNLRSTRNWGEVESGRKSLLDLNTTNTGTVGAGGTRGF